MSSSRFQPVRRRRSPQSASRSSAVLLKGFLQDKVVWVLTMGIVVTMALAFFSETPAPAVWRALVRPETNRSLASSSSSSISNHYHHNHFHASDWFGLTSTKPPVQVVFRHPKQEKQQQQQQQEQQPNIHRHKHAMDRHNHPIHREPDFGGLRIKFHPKKPHFTRKITDHGTGPGPFYRTKDEITQDDDYQLKYDYIWNDEIDPKETDCRFPKMRQMTTYTCNTLHEEFLGDLLRNEQAKFVGHGDYKRVFAVETDNEKYVYKTSKMSFPRKERKNKDGPGWDYDTLGEYTMDGRISSLLGRHPLLVDFYNFCSLSMMSEFLDLGDMEQSAQNYEDRCVHEPVRLSAKAKLASYNNYTGIQKLSYALDMAEGVALLHNHPLGVIVHDDIQLGQFLLGHDGHVKFNDFNRGVIMMYDEKEGAYCKYNMNGKGPGDWRTPEEYRDDLLDQQMDIYSLGNNYYSILTGFYPLPNICEWDDYQKAILKGMRSYLDPRWTKKSYAEGMLVKIIRHVWEEDPNKRPSAGDLVMALRQAYKNSLALEQKSAGYEEAQKEYNAMIAEADAVIELERKKREDDEKLTNERARLHRLYAHDRRDKESNEEKR